MSNHKIRKNYEITYEGDLRVKMKHLKSGTIIHSDAPLDNHGKGESFSPTDLMVSSLVSCVLTIVGIHFRKKERNLSAIHADTQKVMYSEPRRIGEIHIWFDFGTNNFTVKELKIIRQIIETCPVTQSVHPAIEIQSNMEALIQAAELT
jgi:uncharacterized OsmC-like protein